MTWRIWQAGDRDSPELLKKFSVEVDLHDRLDQLLQMEGLQGTNDDEVEKKTGQAISRARRWHKMFERMGLLYPEGGATRLTSLGRTVADLGDQSTTWSKLALARRAIAVLRRYQLKNPADEGGGANAYPVDADLHPYWAIWRAAAGLDWRLHWDELVRELMPVLRHDDLDSAITRIQQARALAGYDPQAGTGLLPRDGAIAGDDDDVRDHLGTPWMKRAGFGELFLEHPGATGRGYWEVPEWARDLLRGETEHVPPFYAADSVQAWFDYYGNLGGASSTPVTLEDKENEVLELLEERGSVVLYGPPGTGKTRAALRLKEWWADQNGAGSVFTTTFHPTYGYEDFVQGFRPSEAKPAEFTLQDGILLRACKMAAQLAEEAEGEQAPKVLLLVDEINRGDVARIFGELITYVELDKRGQTFSLAQSPARVTTIPANLCLLGTMNTADKSISLLDIALRRRFAFVEFPPDPAMFSKPEYHSTVSGIDLAGLLRGLNALLEREGVEPDRAVGQALLAIGSDSPDPVRALRRRLQYDLLPLLIEYSYMDRGRVSRLLPGIADERGRMRVLSDDDLLAAVGVIAAARSAEPMPPLAAPEKAPDGEAPDEDASEEP